MPIFNLTYTRPPSGIPAISFYLGAQLVHLVDKGAAVQINTPTLPPMPPGVSASEVVLDLKPTPPPPEEDLRSFTRPRLEESLESPESEETAKARRKTK